MKKISNKATQLVKKAIQSTPLVVVENDVIVEDSARAGCPMRVESAKPAKPTDVPPAKMTAVVKTTSTLQLSEQAITRLKAIDQEKDFEKINITIQIEKQKAMLDAADQKADARKIEILKGEMEASGISHSTPIQKLAGDYSEMEISFVPKK